MCYDYFKHGMVLWCLWSPVKFPQSWIRFFVVVEFLPFHIYRPIPLNHNCWYNIQQYFVKSTINCECSNRLQVCKNDCSGVTSLHAVYQSISHFFFLLSLFTRRGGGGGKEDRVRQMKRIMLCYLLGRVPLITSEYWNTKGEIREDSFITVMNNT